MFQSGGGMMRLPKFQMNFIHFCSILSNFLGFSMIYHTLFKITRQYGHKTTTLRQVTSDVKAAARPVHNIQIACDQFQHNITRN